jgi:hypothetical protein
MGITLKLTRMVSIITAAGLSAGQAHCWLLDDNTDYGCIVEEAHFTQFDGESGKWTNAPKSLKIRIEDCRKSTKNSCDSGWGRSLNVTPSITDDPEGTNYWGIMGSFSNAVGGELIIDEEKIYASKIGVTADGATNAVFLLSATCFEMGK